jgi:predicted DNA-binding transcriptional regulator AlpA
MSTDDCGPIGWRLLDVRQVADRCGVSVRCVHAWVSGERGDGTFPAPLVRGWWDVCDVDVWLADHPHDVDHKA